MTRINVIPAKLLLDQHLLAEKKEINQLAGQLTKSLRSINWTYSTLPNEFTLGTGHVKFWYLRGGFIRQRYKEVYDECVDRKFNVKDNFNDVWLNKPSIFNRNYSPTDSAIALIKSRISDRVLEKRCFYRYRGRLVEYESYLSALRSDDPSLIKNLI